jgi:hypothetical protein
VTAQKHILSGIFRVFENLKIPAPMIRFGDFIAENFSSAVHLLQIFAGCRSSCSRVFCQSFHDEQLFSFSKAG